MTRTRATALAAAVFAFITTLIVVFLPPDTGSEQPAPAPAPSPTAPAPLPAGTGIDGAGVVPVAPDGLPLGDEEAAEAVTPDAGEGADGHVTETADPGVGGEVFVRSPAWKGAQRLNAGYRYPSGSFHGAWDVGVDRGTKVYAARDALVVGTHDGVRNHPAGGQYAISGSPSNWILLCANVPGYGPSVLYYQHLSPGVAVKRGQKVKVGQYIGKSGNTGNSTGDHLHMSASKVPGGKACARLSAGDADYLRYDYLRSDSRRLFAPSKFWAGVTVAPAKPAPAKPATPVKPTVDASKTRKAAKSHGRYVKVPLVRKALGGKSTSTKWTTGLTARYKAYQRKLGLRGKAADGIPGYWSLSKLAKTSGQFRVVK